MFKGYSGSSPGNGWEIYDNIRGLSQTTYSKINANEPAAEVNGNVPVCGATATGFKIENTNNTTNFIYVAIRRPNKPPAVATDVFYVTRGADDNYTTLYTSGFPVDLFWEKSAGSGGFSAYPISRLTGYRQFLRFDSDAIEGSGRETVIDSNTQFSGFGGLGNANGLVSFYAFKRAPGFMDVVAFDGNSSNQNINHNLEVAPEFYMVKRRSDTEDWATYSASLGANKYTKLNKTAATYTNTTIWNNTSPTSSVFTVGNDPSVNNTGDTYIAYLFATLPGISKVGSFTGTGSAVNVDCGFTSGARFILIRRTDVEITGDTGTNWYYWDSVRGIASGNDPYYLLNTTGGEVTNTDYIDPLSTGFTVTSSAPAGLNASGGNYIFLAIA